MLEDYVPTDSVLQKNNSLINFNPPPIRILLYISVAIVFPGFIPIASESKLSQTHSLIPAHFASMLLSDATTVSVFSRYGEDPASASYGGRGPLYPELSAEAEPKVFPPGLSVLVHGLSKMPQYNGAMGVVRSYDETTNRYGVFYAFGAKHDLWSVLCGEGTRRGSCTGSVSCGRGACSRENLCMSDAGPWILSPPVVVSMT